MEPANGIRRACASYVGVFVLALIVSLAFLLSLTLLWGALAAILQQMNRASK